MLACSIASIALSISPPMSPFFLAPGGDVDEGDLGPLGVGLQMRPPRLGRHPEDVCGEVFLRVLGIGELHALKLGVLSLERLGDVLQEDQAQRDMLVFRRLQIAAQLVSRLEQVGLKAQGTFIFFCSRHESPQKPNGNTRQ